MRYYSWSEANRFVEDATKGLDAGTAQIFNGFGTAPLTWKPVQQSSGDTGWTRLAIRPVDVGGRVLHEVVHCEMLAGCLKNNTPQVLTPTTHTASTGPL